MTLINNVKIFLNFWIFFASFIKFPNEKYSSVISISNSVCWYKFLNQNISINKIKYNKSKQLQNKLLIRLHSLINFSCALVEPLFKLCPCWFLSAVIVSQQISLCERNKSFQFEARYLLHGNIFQKILLLKGALSGLRQFLTTECTLKMMKNAFCFTSKVLFVLKIHVFVLTF